MLTLWLRHGLAAGCITLTTACAVGVDPGSQSDPNSAGGSGGVDVGTAGTGGNGGGGASGNGGSAGSGGSAGAHAQPDAGHGGAAGGHADAAAPADAGAPEVSFTDVNLFPPPPPPGDAGSCANLACFDIFDCAIFHPAEFGPCGFTKCEGLICKP